MKDQTKLQWRVWCSHTSCPKAQDCAKSILRVPQGMVCAVWQSDLRSVNGAKCRNYQQEAK